MALDRTRGLSSAGRVALAYLLVGAAWILLTDRAVLELYLDPDLITTAQTAKGAVFVAGSAVVLYVLVRREERQLVATTEELEDSLRHATVLHRLLRHDLRNSADVIVNNVGLLRSNADDPEACYDRIEERAESLGQIAEKCRHLREALFESARVPVDVAAVARSEVEAFRRRFPDASVTLDAPEQAAALAHPRLDTAIRELLTNAATHDGEDVTVTVDVDDSGETVSVTVADDGPGLPECETLALRGDREAPLSHSQGVGLWLVRFLTTRSEGSIATSSNGPGTTVTLTIPAA